MSIFAFYGLEIYFCHLDRLTLKKLIALAAEILEVLQFLFKKP